jgi:uncharacterized protein (UPF0276 family)
MATLADLAPLGVGLGYRPPFRADLFAHRARVDFLEVTADHYFGASREKRDELDLWPWARLVQMHFAGGRMSDGVLIDSHDAPTSPEVWRLLEAAVARSDVKGIILERDERLPPFEELLEELDTARAIGRRLGRWL